MEHQHTPESPRTSSENATTFVAATAAPKKEFDEAIAKGYEPHDIGLRSVILFISGLALTLVVVLAFVYAVMMALADYDRSKDAIASPLPVQLAPVYAPLQPSLGFNGDHDQDHDVLDKDDMLLMREVTAKALNSDGTSSTGRRYMNIDSAIDTVVSQTLLVSKPAVAPTTEPTYPDGSREGVYGSIPASDIPGNTHVNQMKSLNDYTDTVGKLIRATD
jgi:hypothetical protein